MVARGWGVVVILVTSALGCSASQRTCALDGTGSECPAGNTCRGGICVASGSGCPRVCDNDAGAGALDGGLVDRSTGDQLGAALIEEFPIPTACSGPAFIAAGADGNIWFTEAGTNQIGRVTRDGA